MNLTKEKEKAMIDELTLYAKAFELWEKNYRTNPTKYMTEEVASSCVSKVSVDRAEHFSALIKTVLKGE